MTATRLSFSYPLELKEKLQGLAKKDRRSMSGYVQKVLETHIDCPMDLSKEVCDDINKISQKQGVTPQELIMGFLENSKSTKPARRRKIK